MHLQRLAQGRRLLPTTSSPRTTGSGESRSTTARF
jgi:hypothetical protein